MSKILNLRKIEVKDSLVYDLDKLPLREVYGLSEVRFLDVEICLKYKYGKLNKIWIYPKYRQVVDDPIYFEITPLKKDYMRLDEINGLEIHYCKDHKQQTMVGYIECTNKTKLILTVLNAMTSIGTY
jgi:hypothetical protein